MFVGHFVFLKFCDSNFWIFEVLSFKFVWFELLFSKFCYPQFSNSNFCCSNLFLLFDIFCIVNFDHIDIFYLSIVCSVQKGDIFWYIWIKTSLKRYYWTLYIWNFMQKPHQSVQPTQNPATKSFSLKPSASLRAAGVRVSNGSFGNPPRATENTPRHPATVCQRRETKRGRLSASRSFLLSTVLCRAVWLCGRTHCSSGSDYNFLLNPRNARKFLPFGP